MSHFDQNLEEQLREALRREEPSEGFAERVIQQAGPARAQFKRPEPKRSWFTRVFTWPSVSFAAAAAAVVFMVSLDYHQRQEEEAGRQALIALRIASQKLNMARDKVSNR